MLRLYFFAASGSVWVGLRKKVIVFLEKYMDPSTCAHPGFAGTRAALRMTSLEHL
jgi:energy-converting hydrogenase Eha subunit B